MGQELVQTKNENTVRAFLERQHDSLARAMPTHVSADRLFRTAIGAVARDERLQRCNHYSLIGAIVQASLLGLELNGVLGEAYLVAYGSDAVLVPGFRGLIALARRGGEVREVYAHVVREGEPFRVTYGVEKTITHEPRFDDDADWLGVYAVYKTTDGRSDFKYLTAKDVERRRASSASFRKGFGPWKDHPEPMWEKTAILALMKTAPASVDLMTGASFEDMADRGEVPDYSAALAQADVIPPATRSEALEPPADDGLDPEPAQDEALAGDEDESYPETGTDTPETGGRAGTPYMAFLDLCRDSGIPAHLMCRYLRHTDRIGRHETISALADDEAERMMGNPRSFIAKVAEWIEEDEA